MGKSANKTVQYYEEPVALADYPTLRMYMTHTDGSAGYNAFGWWYMDNWDGESVGIIPHMIATDTEMKHCNQSISAGGWYGPGFGCNLDDTSLRGFSEEYFKFGKVVYYPGQVSHYSWSNALVGRVAEVAYEMCQEKQGTPLTEPARFEDVFKEVISDPAGATNCAFYVPENSTLWDYYSKHYAAGVVNKVTADSDGSTWNYDVANGAPRGAFVKDKTRALGDAGLMCTGKSYWKMMKILDGGRSLDGDRVMRAATARMMTQGLQSHTFNQEEVDLAGGFAVYGSFRNLGGAISASQLYPDKDAAPFQSGLYAFGDTNSNFGMEIGGLDQTSWGGAAGTKWHITPEDNYYFSLQTSIGSSGDISYLSNLLSGVFQDYFK